VGTDNIDVQWRFTVKPYAPGMGGGFVFLILLVVFAVIGGAGFLMYRRQKGGAAAGGGMGFSSTGTESYTPMDDP